MVSVMTASHYITSESRYHSRYRSRSSMYIRGLIPRNLAELAEAVLIGLGYERYSYGLFRDTLYKHHKCLMEKIYHFG